MICMGNRKIFAVHPGSILRKEFMKPLKLSSYKLAKDLHLTAPRVHDIVLERVPSLPILLSVWHNISACLPNSGWGCRLTTTFASPKASSRRSRSSRIPGLQRSDVYVARTPSSASTFRGTDRFPRSQFGAITSNADGASALQKSSDHNAT